MVKRGGLVDGGMESDRERERERQSERAGSSSLIGFFHLTSFVQLDESVSFTEIDNILL